MSEVEIKRFNIALLDECVDLYMKTFSHEPWNESWESRDVVVSFIKNLCANNYFTGFVAVKDSKVVAVSLGFLKPWIRGMEYYIDEFYVDIDHQRQGIGSKLMQEIKRELVSWNIHAIILNTMRNYPSQIFYESVGFKAEESLIILGMSF